MPPAIVILSSSPPRTFACSPTPAESPSPFRSSCALSARASVNPEQFKTSRRVRDGFSGDFCSARASLTTKVGAENIPLLSPGKDGFKAKASQQMDGPDRNAMKGANPGEKKEEIQAEEQSQQVEFFESLTCVPISRFKTSQAIKSSKPEISEAELKQTEGEHNTDMSTLSSPFAQEPAIPRRLDWTPVKPNEHALETPQSEDQAVGFSNDLMESYAFAPSATMAAEKLATKIEANAEERVNRRRIDLVMMTEARPSPPSSKLNTCKNPVKGGSNGKARALAKKALTITGLATSHYCDSRQKETKLPPMLEYLTATQVGARGEAGSLIDVSLKVPKSKASSKKVRATKKAPANSRLKSPTSAIKTTLEQPFLFGPASQLARDESPTLTRDTLEALRRSEGFSSDPISPLSTQPVSIESTSPNVSRGTGRFIKRRNLWAAAGRDEDNALLQVDTVDLTDSPAVRLALAGKDALLQSIGPSCQDIDTLKNGPSGPRLAPSLKATTVEALIDIDDIVTPRLPKSTKTPTQARARSYHTSRTLKQPQKGADIKHQDGEAHSGSKSSVSNPKPIMPSYVGFSDHELKKQISAYGFKTIKKRETMIELLERCWESKNGVQQNHQDQSESADTTKHADLLSKIHDVSTRPGPKIKKSRAKRKSEPGDMSIAKEPKKRKKTATKSNDEPAQKERLSARKRLSTTLSEEQVVDVDDLDDLDRSGNPHIEKNRRSGFLRVQNEPKPPRPKSRPTTQRPLTPPPTVPQLSPATPQACESSRTQSENGVSRVDSLAVEGPGLTPQQTPVPDILSQIHAAIYGHPQAQSKDEEPRNHQISPTWHEKILMYDPIVLEELTVWLNTEGFKAIGEDREVSLLEVRTWCEQNGVCCYGIAGGWRGRAAV